VQGIAASTGSACTSASLDPSHVLLAVPNVSEGREPAAIMGIGAAFASAPGVKLCGVRRHSRRARRSLPLRATSSIQPAISLISVSPFGKGVAPFTAPKVRGGS